MFDINEIFNKLKAGMKIPEEFVFLKKYDKHNKSVFDEDEIAELKNDISIFASKNDPSELSHDEIEAFYKSKIKQDSSLDEINTIYGWINSLLGYSDKTLKNIQKTNEYKNFSKNRKLFVNLMAQNLMRFGENIYAEDFVAHNLDDCTEDDIKRLLPVIQRLNKIPMFRFGDKWREELEEYAGVSEERINEIMEKEYDFALDTLLTLKDADFKKISETIDGTIYKPNENEIMAILSLDDEKTAKLKKFLSVPEIAKLHFSYEINKLVELDVNEFNRMLEIINLTENFQYFDLMYSIDISKLNEDEFNKVKELLNQNIKTKDGEIRITPEIAFYMSELDEKEQENFKKYYALGIFTPDRLKDIAKYTSDELYEFISKTPDIQDIRTIVYYDKLENLIIRCKNNESHVFDLNGEHVEIWREKPNLDNPQGLIIEAENTKLNIKQKAVFDNYSRDTETQASRIETEYYDNENQLIKTLITVKSGIEGIYNKSEIYPDGKVIPLQFVSSNSETGEIVVSNNLVSPDGIKTEYHFEKSPDNVEIVNYKITDKEGKILLNWENTHHKISDNEYLSSINGHTYKAVYDDMKILITDNKNGKTHTIDLNGIISVIGCNEYIINSIKSIPANQLLALNQFPINIKYDEYDKTNSHWDSQLDSIVIGDHTSTQNEFVSVFKHEFGHYIDTRPDKSRAISSDKELDEISQKELQGLINSLTVLERNITGHLIGDGLSDPNNESTAETIMLLSCGEPFRPIRALNLMEYCPRRIARIAQLFEKRMTEITED